MTVTMPDFDIDRAKDYIRNVAYVVFAVVAASILIEAMLLKTLNLALLEALSALMLLF